ncbi:sensor histidine kinase [Falsibacillus albus]|uniref:histidine kinase n=1 Tax=Falsibacillus albus TaxID=2478915 RepID=A0A3L7K0T6_9BACI|nr:HAMP domain-containing sensor histidine kinase [Falsibacillus albus]RLQ96205.1 sensor histidine kinase [Falsibacillus albus]
MFQKTRIRLTILNSFIFIVLISILGFIIYSYAYENLFKDVNRELMDTNQKIISGALSPRDFHFRDPRTSIILWDEKGKLIQPEALNPIYEQNKEDLKPKKMGELEDIKLEHFYFRSIANVVDTNVGKITVQVIRITTSEKEMLNRLLWMMIIGCTVSSVLAVAAGYFLAERALIPIKRSWEKQQQFVTDASHELRTPLTVIQSKTDLLFREPDATIEEKALDISGISNETRRLTKLVSHLLTLARSDSDQAEVKKEEFRMDELLASIAAQFEDVASFEGKLIRVEREPVTFKGDKERIHQMIVIFLDNALKYTDEKGKILLTCYSSQTSITIEVKDNGVGMNEEDLPKIFDRFYQTDASRSSNEGAGLGLSIAKWIIEKHHGKVKVASELGEGSTFIVTFPKHQK